VTGDQRSRLLGRLLVVLLLVDAVLGWLALQASFVFLELVWRALAGREDWRPLLESHVRQFGVLRAIDAAALAVTVAAFVAWLKAVRAVLRRDGRLAAPASGVRPLRTMVQTWRALMPGAGSRAPALLGWWWVVFLATVAAKIAAAARLLAAGSPVDLGTGLQLTIIGAALQIALAVLTIFVVVAIQREMWTRPLAPP
jgi:Domain of unknown function (DUF4328)